MLLKGLRVRSQPNEAPWPHRIDLGRSLDATKTRGLGRRVVGELLFHDGFKLNHGRGLHGFQAGYTLDNFCAGLGWQKVEHLGSYAVFQHRQNNGHHLGVFGLDHVGNRTGVHPAQDLQALAALAGVDAPQHRGGLVVAQGALEDFFYIVRGAQAQIGLAFDLGHKLVQHRIDSFLREFSHLHHGHAQALYFFGVEVANDVGGLFFAQQQHEHGGTLGAAHLGHFFFERLRCRFLGSQAGLAVFFFSHLVVSL